MSFVTTITRKAKAITLAFAILTMLTAAVSAQRVDPSQQGKMYGDAGFRGEPINLNVVNADIRDILSYITDQYGINFVIDRSVKDVPVTVKVEKINPKLKVIYYDTVTLNREGDEKTVVRFNLSDDGNVSDLNTRPVSLIREVRK